MPDTEAISLIQDAPEPVTPSAMGVMPAPRSVLSFGDTTESAPNATQPQGQDPYQIQQPYFMPPYRPMATIPDYQLSGIYQQTSTNTTTPSLPFAFPLPFMEWLGTWDMGAAYNTFDCVQFNTSTYIALQANSGQQPNLNPSTWTLVSENFVFNARSQPPTQVNASPFVSTFDKVAVSKACSFSPSVGPETAATLMDIQFLLHETATGVTGSARSALLAANPNLQDLGIPVFGSVAAGQPFFGMNFVPKGTASTIAYTTGAANFGWYMNSPMFASGTLTSQILATATNAALTSNVLTVTAANNFQVGHLILLSGFTGSFTFLNGTVVTVATQSSTQFTAAVTHANVGSASITGTCLDTLLRQAIATPATTAGTYIIPTASITPGSAILVLGTSGSVNGFSNISGVSDTQFNPYTLSTQSSFGTCNGSSTGMCADMAWTTNTSGGSNTLSVTTTHNDSAFVITVLEFEGGGSHVFTYYPYDVKKFRGNYYVCINQTTSDAFADPNSWGQLSLMPGSVNAQTTNYTPTDADDGALIPFNSGSAHTLTLPSPPIHSRWWTLVENIGAGTVTISHNGLTIDGIASDLSLVQNTGVLIFTDGTNYFTCRGITSLSLTMPAEFVVSGSPGNSITVTKATESANTAWMGPTTGAAAAPTFRQPQDLDLLLSNITTNNVSTSAHGFAPILPNDASKFLNGIGTYTTPSASGLLLQTNGTNNGSQTTLNLAQGTNVTLTDNGSGTVTIAASSSGAGVGGVNAQTADYTALSGDSGKLITFNKATAVNLTLPSSAPSSTWFIDVENRGLGILNILRNGLTIDGANLSFFLRQHEGVRIFSDGTNYFMQMRDTGIPRYNTRRTAKFIATGSTSATFATLILGAPLGDVPFNAGGTFGGAAASSGIPANITCTSSATNNATLGNFGGNNNYVIGTNIRFQCYAKLNDFASGRYWFGVSSGSLSASANPAGNYAAFRADKSVPDTNFQCITKDGTTQTVTDSGIAIDTNFHKFEIIFNDNLATPNVQFFLDGALVATNTTHLPSAATALRAEVEATSTASAARTFTLAWYTVETDI